MRVLVVEDDAKIASFVVRGLKQAGYAVDHAPDGETGLALAECTGYDTAIVDVMLPGLDGLSLVRRLRAARSRIPVLFLSAKGAVEDRVRGLESGADDYLTKPFAFSELLARVQALIRRATNAPDATRIVAGDVSLDLVTREVTSAGKPVELQPREFSLLAFLLRHAGHPVSKTKILEQVWDYSFDPQTNVVDVVMHRLRSKVDPDHVRIETLRGVGYVFRPMLERFRQSLAIRLAAMYTLVFAAGASALFGVLYWVLALSLEARERAAVELRAAILARAYELGGAPELRARLEADTSPEVRSLFVRLLGVDGVTVFATVPSDWVDPQVERRLVPDGWGGWSTQEIHSVRVPRDAARDFAVASRVLSDGRLIQVARSTDSRAVLLAPLRRDFAGVGAVALLSSLTAGTFLAWRATRPLREVAETARRILDEHDLSARVPAPGGSGELAVLARQLNTLLDKNATHVRVLRETLDDLAHDLRTPLTRLRGTAELALRDGGNPAESRSALAACVDETDRVLHLLEVLLDVSAAEAGALTLRRERVDLRALATRAAELYREVAEQKNIRLALDLPAHAEMDGDPVRLGQALSNLVDNALKYTPEGGRVTVAVAAEPGARTVTVSDSGPGVPAAERDAVWRRLYRGDSSRSQRGWGLGLTLVRAVAEAHGGTAEVGDAPGGGAQFRMRFPAA